MKKLVSLFFMLILLSSSISFAATSRIADEPGSGGTAATSTTHIYLNGKEITSIDSSGTRLFYHQDYLGSTRIITNPNGSLVARIDYEPFGRKLVDTQKAKYTFTGKEEDPSTGLQYFGARYYDADTGIFTQIDPKYNTAQSPYVYANNNPLKYVDPSGMSGQCTNCPDALTVIPHRHETRVEAIHRIAQRLWNRQFGRHAEANAFLRVGIGMGIYATTELALGYLMAGASSGVAGTAAAEGRMTFTNLAAMQREAQAEASRINALVAVESSASEGSGTAATGYTLDQLAAAAQKPPLGIFFPGKIQSASINARIQNMINMEVRESGKLELQMDLNTGMFSVTSATEGGAGLEFAEQTAFQQSQQIIPLTVRIEGGKITAIGSRSYMPMELTETAYSRALGIMERYGYTTADKYTVHLAGAERSGFFERTFNVNP